jgi:glycerol uptake facilitator-like aquaporin
MKIQATLQKLIVEFLGATLIMIAVAGSLVHVTTMSQLAAAATIGLAILVTTPVSGGHLNPAVSLFYYSRKVLSLSEFLLYSASQIAGGVLGTVIGLQLWNKAVQPIQLGTPPSLPILLGEWVATGGLVFLYGYLGSLKKNNLIAVSVAVWIFSIGTLSQSGAEANPAISLALIAAGQSVAITGWLIIAQLVGLLSGVLGLMVFTAKAVKKRG